MENNIKLRFLSGLVAVTLSTGFTMVGSPTNAYAETALRNVEGTFIEYEENDDLDEEKYNIYIVKRGDNASHISKKICKYFEVAQSTKYWPVIAYLNDYPRVINPGDEIKFPTTFEEMDDLLKELNENGWVRKYKEYLEKMKERKANSEYGPNTVGAIIDEIYGKGASKNEEFVKKYLKIVGLGNKNYNVNSKLTRDQIFELTEWIPTEDELGMSPKQNSKKK